MPTSRATGWTSCSCGTAGARRRASGWAGAARDRRGALMPLTVWSSARYTFPLPVGHRFPVVKYAMLRDRVVAEGIVPPERVLDPESAADPVLLLVHTEDYVRRFVGGALGD